MMRSRPRTPLPAWLLAALASASPALAQDAAPAAEQPPSAAPTQGAPTPAGPPEARLDLIEAALAPAPNGITAEEVVARALETSPRIISAGLQSDKAAANKARAKLMFAPRLDLMGKYTRLSRVTLPPLNFNGMETPNPFPQILNQWWTNASVSMPITDLFLTIIPTYRAASTMSDVSSLQQKAVELEVSYAARVAFYNYVRAQGFLVATNDRIRVLEASVRDLEALHKAGTVRTSDLMRAQAALADAKAAVTMRIGAVELAVLQLSQLMGEQFDLGRGIGEPLVGREIEATPELPSVVGNARSGRPEVLALRKVEEARGHVANARRGGRWPKLSAFGNYYYANPNQRVFPLNEEWNGTWDAGLMLSWSPNDFAMAQSQANDADTDLALVAQDLRAIEDGVSLEATAAVNDHRTAREEVNAKIQRVEAAKRYYNDQRALLLAGAATPNDVLEAENQLHDAELAWIDAYVHTRLAQAALLKAQGQTGLSSRSRSTP